MVAGDTEQRGLADICECHGRAHSCANTALKRGLNSAPEHVLWCCVLWGSASVEFECEGVVRKHILLRANTARDVSAGVVALPSLSSTFPTHFPQSNASTIGDGHGLCRRRLNPAPASAQPTRYGGG